MASTKEVFVALIGPKLDILAKAYVVGDYLGAPGFRNKVMGALKDEYAQYDGAIPIHNR